MKPTDSQNIQCVMVDFDPGPDGQTPTWRDKAGNVLENLAPGSMYWMHRKITCVAHQVPCSHLMVVAPGGAMWDIDSIGCGRMYPHNCWIRHGEPPQVTVDKDGSNTCDSGRGSFTGRASHVFLWDGEFIDLNRLEHEGTAYFYALKRDHRARLLHVLSDQISWPIDRL